MTRFRQILYLERRTGGSRRAFECAARVAARHRATLTVAGVTGVRLEGLVEQAARHDVRVRVAGGGAAGRGPVVERAGGEHDLLVTVARGRPAAWSGGDPVVHDLVSDGGCPVWVLHPAQGAEVRVVLAAVDLPSPDGALSRRVLRTAAALAGDGVLHVVHCWWVRGESLLVDRSRGGDPREARRVLAATEQSHREALERFVREESVTPRPRIVLRKDTVVPGLREVAWGLEADVVVVGASSRTGLAERLLKSTAERLIGRVPASVLVVPQPDAASVESAGSEAERAAEAGSPGRSYPRRGRVGRGAG